MGSNPGKPKKPSRATASYPQDEEEPELDMFQTESFRPGSGRERRPAPASRPGGDTRAAPLTRPLRQESRPAMRQQTVERSANREPVSANVNPWLNESVWPESDAVAPLTPFESTNRNRHQALTAFPAQPPPYEAVETPIRPKPVGRSGANPADTNRNKSPVTEQPPDEPLQVIPEETSRVDSDKPDLSHYEVPSLLSPEHQMHMADEPRLIVAPPTGQSVHEKDDDEYIGANLKFYRNQIRYRPNGEFIDYIHRYWFRNYRTLEKCHTYIQWLFPISESSSVNMEAVPLRAHEAKHIYGDLETRSRYINSYKMMLDFYGFRITDLQTGKIERKENWSDRFYNLLRNTHNYARITRILKSLGELGLHQYQSPFVMALLHEVFETKYLHGVPRNTVMYWVRAINNQFERDYMYKLFQDNINKQDTGSRKHYYGKENHGIYVDKRRANPLVIGVARKKY